MPTHKCPQAGGRLLEGQEKGPQALPDGATGAPATQTAPGPIPSAASFCSALSETRQAEELPHHIKSPVRLRDIETGLHTEKLYFHACLAIRKVLHIERRLVVPKAEPAPLGIHYNAARYCEEHEQGNSQRQSKDPASFMFHHPAPFAVRISRQKGNKQLFKCVFFPFKKPTDLFTFFQHLAQSLPHQLAGIAGFADGIHFRAHFHQHRARRGVHVVFAVGKIQRTGKPWI